MSEIVKLTVICPVYNEGAFISQCVESLLKQDFPKEQLEIFFVDGMSTDNTREIISRYVQTNPFIYMLDNPFRTVPFAMNKGIRNAKGEVIARVDAHALYPSDYLSTLYRRLYELKADNVGCNWHTDVQTKTDESLAIREVLCNKWGVGNSVFRTGVSDVQLVDTVPFGCFPKETFEKYGLYDSRLDRDQDIELNKRIAKGGGKIYIVPDTYCVYFARETYRDLAQNSFDNGKWNIWTLFYTRNLESLSVRHLIPFFFILSLLMSLFLGFVFPKILILFALILLSYLLLVGLVSYRLSKEKNLRFSCLMKAFLTLHFSYGVGSLMGFVLWPFK